MMQKYTVTDENSQKQELYSKTEHIEADNAALRLKVQGLDRTLADEIDDHIESAKAEIIRLNDRIVVLTRAKEILIKQREVEQVNTR